ncbi:hypothetical protein DVH05_005373 [Phytophthora capsici]|nr:hypothetical protein DVH05_005373 [Phytophthora capsici]
MNPLSESQISPSDRIQLEDLANGIIMSNLENCNAHVSSGKRKVDSSVKQIKDKE